MKRALFGFNLLQKESQSYTMAEFHPLLSYQDTPCWEHSFAVSVDLQITQQGALCEHCSYHPLPPLGPQKKGIIFCPNMIFFTELSFFKLRLCFRTWISQLVLECDCKATGIAFFFFFLILNCICLT